MGKETEYGTWQSYQNGFSIVVAEQGITTPRANVNGIESGMYACTIKSQTDATEHDADIPHS
jgi:hypothetical protein